MNYFHRWLIALQLFLLMTDAEKPFILNVLVHTLSFTQIHKATYEFAVEWLNNQTDILPDYYIKLDLRDEGSYGSNASENVIRFVRDHEEETINSASPISIGPLFSPGCKAAGRFAHYVDHIMLSTSCTASVLNDRKINPNLFLALSTHDPKSYGILKFMKEIGGWNRFALYTNPLNINDFNFAMKFYQVAYEIGMEIVIFDSVVDFDEEAALKLKKTNARVIVIWTGDDYYDFFCKAWNVGIKGERYVFISFYKEFSFQNYDCPEALHDQHKRLLVLNEQPVSSDPDAIATFGYSRNQFESLFVQYLEDNGLSHITRRQWRFVANDMVMQLAVILDASEKRLKSDYNLTLRHFNTHRKLVMKVVKL